MRIFGVFDEGMENWTRQQQAKLATELEEIGFTGEFVSAIESYQKFKGIRQTGNFSPSLRQSLRVDLERGIYVSRGGELYNTKIWRHPQGRKKFLS